MFTFRNLKLATLFVFCSLIHGQSGMMLLGVGGGSHGGGTVALVATSVVGTTSSGSPGTITTSGTGHGLFALLQVNSAAQTVSSITDSAGDTWTLVATSPVACEGFDNEVWYTPSTVGAVTTITTTSSGGQAWLAVVYETTGTNASAPLDQHATLTSSGLNATGAAVTIASASELIVSSVNVQGAVSGIFGGNPFTNDSTQNGNGWAHLLTTSTGTYTPQWSSTGSGTTCSTTASFKP